MKHYFLFSIALLFFTSSFSQERLITEEDVVNQYPYPVNFFHLTIQKEEMQMAYMDVSPAKSNGRTALLLHGKNFNGAYWGQTIKALTDDGYRVIVPDQVGFGRSTYPKNMQYSFQQLAKNTKALLDSLNIKNVYVIGHSMGGMLAIRFTLMYPEEVVKMILVDPIGMKELDKSRKNSTVDELYQQELTQDFEKIKEYQVKTYYHNNWKNEYKRWALMLSYTYQGEKKELTAWNSAKVYDMINTQPVVYDLKKVKIPSMIIAGELDPMIPDANILRSLTSQNLESNFRIESMKGIGHSPHIEDFPAFYQLLSSFIK